MAPRTSRSFLLLLVCGGLAFAIWLLRAVPQAEAANESDEPTHLASAAALIPGSLESPALARSDSRRKVLRIEDRLNAASLDLAVRLLDGGLELDTLRPGEVVDLSGLAHECSVNYALGSSNIEQTVPLSECLREGADHWLISLPYSCRLEINLQAQVLPNAEVGGQVLLCQDPRTLPEPLPLEEGPGPFTRPEHDMTLEGLIQWRLRSGQLKALQQAALCAQNPAPLSVAAAGAFVVNVQFSDGSSGVAPVDLVPGQIIPVPVFLRSRPSLQVRLLDWEGQPVPNEKVVLTVALDLTDYDFRLSDPHGLMVYQQEGVLTQSVKKTYKTDASGFVEVRVPRGKEYALYSYARDGYAFWSTLSGGGAPTDSMTGELMRAPPSEEGRVKITVLQADGQPLSEAQIVIALAGDLPFFRQWPNDLMLDEQGTISVAGLEPGMLVGLMIHHDSLTRGTYTPKYPTVPMDRRIEVRLPAESYLAFQ